MSARNLYAPSGTVLRSLTGYVTPILVATVVAGCHRQVPPPRPQSLPSKSVTVVGVETHGLATFEEVVGTVRATLRSAVEAKIPGRIEALLVVPGQAVQAGDTLASLDAREVKARLDSTLAVREQTGRDLDRLRKLVRDGAATAADLDAIETRHRVAMASVTEAETMLGHTRVVAPFAGVITRKLADVGDLAVPGRPLVEIEDPSRLRIEADLPEALIDRVQMGMKLPVRIGSLPSRTEGVVGEIAPVAEALSRTYSVKLDLPSIPGLRAGQFGRVSVPTGEAAGLHVPATALVQRGQLEYVFVADAGQAHLRLIRSGRRPNGMVEVVSGLVAGEKVVAPLPTDLQDGQPLEVKP